MRSTPICLEVDLSMDIDLLQREWSERAGRRAASCSRYVFARIAEDSRSKLHLLQQSRKPTSSMIGPGGGVIPRCDFPPTVQTQRHSTCAMTVDSIA